MSSLNVFLIEFDHASASARSKALKDLGYIITAESFDGGKAYKEVRKLRPDVIIASVDCKISHVKQTIEAISRTKVLSNIPIMLFSSKTAFDRHLLNTSYDIIPEKELINTLSEYASKQNHSDR